MARHQNILQSQGIYVKASALSCPFPRAEAGQALLIHVNLDHGAADVCQHGAGTQLEEGAPGKGKGGV